MAFGFLKNLWKKLTGKPVDWDELEESLIRADLGLSMTNRILDALKARTEKITADDVLAVAQEEIVKILPRDNWTLRPFPTKPKVLLIVGVNGTGKTTSTAKLGALLKKRGHSILFAAADTFRAAAIEQLGIWADRIGAPIVKGQYNADPAALCLDAYRKAEADNIEFVICDTAGRLHTKHNLMAELGKVKRVLQKADADAPHETLLVVDATTGSNALAQAKEFHAATQLTGLICTKLDGSGKGGVIVAIQNELNLPTRFIGTGEKPEDFAFFESRDFATRMLAE